MSAGFDMMELAGVDLRRRKEVVFVLYDVKIPTRPTTDGRYYVKVPDITMKGGRRTLSAKSREDLEEKVFAFLSGRVRSRDQRSLSDVFSLVQDRLVSGISDPSILAVKRSTVRRHWQTWERYFAGSAFAALALADISPVQIVDFCEACVLRFGLKKHELSGIRGAIKSCFDYGEMYGLLPPDRKNSYERADFSHCLAMLKRGAAVSDRGYSSDEMDRILMEIHRYYLKKPSYLVPHALELQIVLGLRRGEIAALKWSDISDGLLVVRRSEKSWRDQSGEHFYLAGTKTGAVRSVPITDRALSVLSGIRAVHDRLGLSSEFLFPDPGTELGIVSLNSIYEYFRRLCDRVRVPVSRDLIRGTHAFRRNLSSDIRRVASAEDAAGILGHSVGVDDASYWMGPDADRMREVLRAAGH